jgi:outer membrane protein assembly factor BamB
MNRSRMRTLVILGAIAATLFVARPARGAASTDPVVWSTPLDQAFDLVTDGAGVVVVSGDNAVHALGRDGREQWTAHVASTNMGQPAVGSGVVLVGGDHTVTALARADGSPRWQRSTAAATYSVAIAGDLAVAGDLDGTLAAFDAPTGAPRWSVKYPGMLWSGARSDPASGSVVATWHRSPSAAVRAFDLATGALRWEAPTAVATAAPVVRGGLVVLAIGDGNRHARVEARDLATGRLRWQTPVPASFEEGIEPAADDRSVAVIDHFGVVSLLDLRTGHLRWQHDLAHALLETRVSLTRDRVVVTSFSGDVFVLDRRDGHTVARWGWRRLDGYPVATLQPRWRGPDRLLVALRLREWAVQLRALP